MSVPDTQDHNHGPRSHLRLWFFVHNLDQCSHSMIPLAMQRWFSLVRSESDFIALKFLIHVQSSLILIVQSYTINWWTFLFLDFCWSKAGRSFVAFNWCLTIFKVILLLFNMHSIHNFISESPFYLFSWFQLLISDKT